MTAQSVPGEAGSRCERAMVAIMFATWGLVFLDRMSVLYLAPYIARDLHLDDAQVGMLAGVVAVSWALSALAFGVLSDRLGRKAILVPMVLLFSVISAASGLARDFEQLLCLRALLGVAEGPCWSVMMALVEENSPPRRRGRNIGIVVSAAAMVGLAIAPVLTTQVAAHLGWRDAFFVAAVPGALLAVLIARFVSEAPRERRAASGRVGLSDVRALLRHRNLWASAVGAAGFMTWLFLVNAFGPLYITQIEHQSGRTAGLLMGAAGLGSFMLGLIAPAMSDRVGRRPMLAFCAVLSVILPIALLSHGLYESLWLLALILFCTQAGQAISAICIVLVPTESVPRGFAATAIGFATLCGELIGGFLAPLVGGDLAERHGLALPLWMAAAGAGVVLLSAVAMRPAPRAAVASY
jgi:MFS family permease